MLTRIANKIKGPGLVALIAIACIMGTMYLVTQDIASPEAATLLFCLEMLILGLYIAYSYVKQNRVKSRGVIGDIFRQIALQDTIVQYAIWAGAFAGFLQFIRIDALVPGLGYIIVFFYGLATILFLIYSYRKNKIDQNRIG